MDEPDPVLEGLEEALELLDEDDREEDDEEDEEDEEEEDTVVSPLPMLT